MTNPLIGAVSRFRDEEAPEALRRAVALDGPDPGYPYPDRLDRDAYDTAMHALQIELVKLQSWARETGTRIAVVFEGRDAAGKGGTIKRFRENLNPRGARVVALAKPSDREAGQWYFQRYVAHLPAAGEIVFFDRSWYNRGVVEHVFGFCTPAERAHFFVQVPDFEAMLVEDGILLFKIWLTVGRAEQLRRFLKREGDPLKHWKLSAIDIGGLPKWDAYTDAIRETLACSHTDHAPWTLVRADDKRRGRLGAMQAVLSRIPYSGRDDSVACAPDPAIVGGPELFDA